MPRRLEKYFYIVPGPVVGHNAAEASPARPRRKQAERRKIPGDMPSFRPIRRTP